MRAAAASFEPVTSEMFATALAQVFEAAEPSAGAISVGIMQSPVGTLMLGASEDALCALEFIDAASLDSRLRSLRPQHPAVVGEPNDMLDRVRSQLDDYFAGRRRSFDVPLSCGGTVFQQQVWSQLCQIPYGQTWSYLELARRVGDVGATRAVGMANGANPIAIVIPCHRVVNASGELGGYGGGLWRKRILLDLEKGQAQFAF